MAESVREYPVWAEISYLNFFAVLGVLLDLLLLLRLVNQSTQALMLQKESLLLVQEQRDE